MSEDAPATLDPWSDLARLTPARIALGRAGASLPTAEILRFGLAHAQARDAVHLPLDVDLMEDRLTALGFPTFRVTSAAASRDLYLRRPDLGRRLSAVSRERLAAVPRPADEAWDLAVMVGDGLSSSAITANVEAFLSAFRPHLAREGWRLAPLVLATGARVALGDEVATLLGARAVVVLIGERPGLSSPDSLGAYLTLAPKVGSTDAERNCISNIRAAGLAPAAAAAKLSWLLGQAFRRGLSGVALKDEDGAASIEHVRGVETSA